MKITVLSGSPKGDLSISLQYFYFLAKYSENIEYTIFHIGEKINLIANNNSELTLITDSVKNSDAVLWVFPVYHFLVPSQIKQFIEIINSKSLSSVFKEKYSTSIITSIHFYDTIAENYIHAVSEDLGMNYSKGFLAEMNDLKKNDFQSSFLNFGNRFFSAVQNKHIFPKVYKKFTETVPTYIPADFIITDKNSDYKIILITDNSYKYGNMKNLVNTFINKCSNTIEIINLDEVEIRGGCLGCCSCGYDNICIYKDGLNDFLKSKFINSDAIIFASEIKDRYMSWQIKRLWDRSFLFGHKPATQNKKMVYILSGLLSQNHILKNEIEARCGVGKTPLIDIISDEFLSSNELSHHITQTADNLISALKNNLTSQDNFHTVAGHKIFRDFVFLMKFVFRADHHYYSKTKSYDFSNKNTGMRILNRFLLILLKIKPFRYEFNKRIKSSMIKSLKFNCKT